MFDKGQSMSGRTEPLNISVQHFVNGAAMNGPFPSSHEIIIFGMGCFWGVEKLFWQKEGVIVTAAGYAGGNTLNPHYEEICTGMTGHTEVVQVVFDPQQLSLVALLTLFWESHDPTQGMRQGNDQGSQYRSAIYTSSPNQSELAEQSQIHYQQKLNENGRGEITTEIKENQAFFFAEDHHQQYLAKNPSGYCALQGLDIPYG